MSEASLGAGREISASEGGSYLARVQLRVSHGMGGAYEGRWGGGGRKRQGPRFAKVSGQGFAPSEADSRGASERVSRNKASREQCTRPDILNLDDTFGAS